MAARRNHNFTYHKNILSLKKKRPVGRPRGRRITVHINLLPEIDSLIETQAEAHDMTKGKYIEMLAMRAIKAWPKKK